MNDLVSLLGGPDKVKEESGLDKFFAALGGFGAGYEGRGGQYLQQKQQMKAAEEDQMLKRKVAGAQDFQTVKKLLESGNVQGARKMLERRVSVIGKQGKDPQDTLEFMGLLEKDPSQAMEILSNVERESIARGWVKPPAQPKRTIDADRGVQIIENLDGTVETRPIEGLGMTDKDRLDMEYKQAQIEGIQSGSDMDRKRLAFDKQKAEQTNMQVYDEMGLSNRRIALEEEKFQRELEAAQKDGGVKLTEGEAKTVSLGSRMHRANTIMSDLTSGGYDPTNFRDVAARKAGNTAAMSKEGQLYYQAAGEFIAGVLRKDSGAALTNEDWGKNLPLYIPGFGDKEETVKQKANSRTSIIDDFGRSLGGGEKTALMYGSKKPDNNQGGADISTIKKAREALARKMVSQ